MLGKKSAVSLGSDQWLGQQVTQYGEHTQGSVSQVPGKTEDAVMLYAMACWLNHLCLGSIKARATRGIKVEFLELDEELQQQRTALSVNSACLTQAAL